jgi:hypothetical protein
MFKVSNYLYVPNEKVTSNIRLEPASAYGVNKKGLLLLSYRLST